MVVVRMATFAVSITLGDAQAHQPRTQYGLLMPAGHAK